MLKHTEIAESSQLTTTPSTTSDGQVDGFEIGPISIESEALPTRLQNIKKVYTQPGEHKKTTKEMTKKLLSVNTCSKS